MVGDPQHDSRAQDAGLAEWQSRARPFMTRTIVALALFFFAASLAQLVWLNWHIAHPPTLAASSLLDGSVCGAGKADDLAARDCLAVQERRAVILLEENLVSRRYHQSNAIVMFSVWSRYLGFVTGMILAFVGSAFILGKMAEGATSVSAEGGGFKSAMSSTSPGLVMSFLGVVLMIASITTLHSLNTRDGPTYLGWAAGDEGAASPSGVKLRPPATGEDADENSKASE